MRVDSAGEIAAVMRARWGLDIAGGISIANPIPVDDEIPADQISGIIEQALLEMEKAGIAGKEATPYLLGRIVELTNGESLRTNIALVKNNARLGAQVAIEYAALS
jgi:pseudouridine-5'-phosphate glycosidase